MEDLFEEHRVLDAEVISNARNGAVVDVNGTQIKLFQRDEHFPMIMEIYIEAEEEPIGTVNLAGGRSVCYGSVENRLSDRIEEIRQLPLEEVGPALKELEEELEGE